MTVHTEKHLLIAPLLAPALGIEWLEEGWMVVFKPEAIYSTMIANWTDAVISILTAWPDDRPCLFMYDLSARGVGLMYSFTTNHDLLHIGVTVEGKAKVAELFQQRPALRGRLAVVLSARLSGKFVNRHAIQSHRERLTPSPQPPSPLVSQTFMDRESALFWLSAGLGNSTAGP